MHEAQEKKVLKPCVELKINQRNLSEPTVRVAWCVSDDALKELREKKIKYPHLLIVVAQKFNDGSMQEYERKLVPLDKAMEFVVFQHAGQYKIFAAIVWSNLEAFHDMMDKITKSMCEQHLFNFYLARTCRRYDTDLIGRSSELISNIQIRTKCFLENSEIIAEENVIVSKEFFAPEPPPWLKTWVNLFFPGLASDQCNFRRRAIFAFTIQPFLFIFLWLIMNAINFAELLLALLIGLRIRSVKHFINATDLMDQNEIFDNLSYNHCKTYWWKTSADEKKEYKWIIPTWLAMPLVWLPVLATFTLLIIFQKQVDWSVAWWIIGVIGGIFLLAIIGCLILDRSQRKQKEKSIDPKIYDDLLNNYYSARLLPISCMAGNIQTGQLKELPKTHRTVRLYYLDLKSRICKPFQK